MEANETHKKEFQKILDAQRELAINALKHLLANPCRFEEGIRIGYMDGDEEGAFSFLDMQPTEENGSGASLHYAGHYKISLYSDEIELMFTFSIVDAIELIPLKIRETLEGQFNKYQGTGDSSSVYI